MNKKKGSIRPLLMRLFAVFIILLLVLLFTMMQNIQEVKRLAYECMEDKASLYVDLLSKDIKNLSTEFLVMRVRDNEELMALPKTITPQESKYYELLHEITDSNFTRRAVYENQYRFYEYVDSADFLILDSAVYFSTSRKSAEVGALAAELHRLVEEDARGVIWDFFEADGADYLYGFFQQEGRAVGCLVKLDELFENIQITNLGYEGIPFLEKDGQVYMCTKDKARTEIAKMARQSDTEYGISGSYAWYTYQVKHVGNLKILLVLSQGMLDQIFGIQSLLIVVFIFLVLVTLWILLYFYQNILSPMRRFVDGLKNPEKDTWLNENQENGILELEYASGQFKAMFRELQSLRIAIYEKELMEKKIELEYVQEQIRPHFFLNCLSIIQGMAEMRHADDIVHISEVLSDYMSYVIKDTFEMRTIRDEVEHIQNYIDIQTIRRPGAFTYELIMEEEVGNCLIPPLVLQTFVENSISHGMKAEGQIEVTLYLTIEEIDGNQSLYITLSDTGTGFPEEILLAIEEDTPIVYNGREHIGIRNTIKRLHILYGNQANVRLCNMAKNYGAVVEIVMPAVLQK